jgi:hypothetical protein
MKTNSKVTTHDSRLFAWSGLFGAAEASDFKASLLREDSFDEGFYVRSHRTGVSKFFRAVGTRRIAGDVVSWLYKSTDGFIVEIFND